MAIILALDIAGTPKQWITVREAVTYHATDSVAWSLGPPVAVYHGGIQRRSGNQSKITTSSIIAITGSQFDVHRYSRVQLNNRTLFGRDRNMCAYCGRHFTSYHDLSRDHIMPRSRGGTNTWMNCVTACRSCNGYKGDRTLDEANMELLYLPYTPCHSENMILQNRNILHDQMEYLQATLPKYSRIRKISA